MSHRRTVEPSELAVDYREVLEHAVIYNPDETSYVRGLCVAAVEAIENYTQTALISQTWELKLDGWMDKRYTRPTWFDGRNEWSIIVPRPPLIAVSSVQYIDTAGTTQTIATSKYDVDSSSRPGRIVRAYAETWPAARAVPGSITITHTAGFGTTVADIPQTYKLAIQATVADWYDDRENAGMIPEHAKHLLAPYTEVTIA